ncbi:isopeptide-forming domain-containing fimbrial protein [Biformimicrobium ophioploci]|uniref:SdrD B-like domain-containing protein n=1 Tax=Biformimicrobium ophioploci TaxID=3036711 RepID=A0ABQ6LWC5_9GAMM|nr:isopeptide-forming domain-containing fimbrial protein [Microbulbifer sp. NKW57]GMG86400.1 SdrD B-like domain-containing protein [Microbulbifer sp. NKW57]
MGLKLINKLVRNVVTGRGLVLRPLLGVLLSLVVAQVALADSFKVSDFETVPTAPPNLAGMPDGCLIDGPYMPTTDGTGRTMAPQDQLSINRSCTIRNFTCDVPLESTLNFAGVPDGTLIIFDNVCFGGNFACANVDGKASVWAVNGSDFSTVREGCQDLVIPVEKIEKRATDLTGTPISQVTVGVPFIYMLDVPVLFDPVNGTVLQSAGSLNDIQSITIQDDLSLAALGVDLRLESVTAYYEDNSGATVPMSQGSDYSFSNSGSPVNPGTLTFEILNPATLPAGAQVHFSIQVVLKDSPVNSVGTFFTNIATWEFAREINGTFYDPLPGENGVADLLSISSPDLVLTKTTSATAVNFTDQPGYSISVQNVGGTPAWNVVVEDQLPVAMQELDPTSLPITVSMGGTPLSEGTHYTLSYTSPPAAGAGLLRLELLDAAGGLAQNATLQINYSSQLNQPGQPNEPANGDVLENGAAATAWYNDASGNNNRAEFLRTFTDGTVGTDDHQDVASVEAALSGYYFEKTVANQTIGAYPATRAAPGDVLLYNIHLFNVDQNITDIVIRDTVPTGLTDSSVTTCRIDGPAAPAVVPVCTLTGNQLLVQGNGGALSLPQGYDLVVEFQATVGNSLANGAVVSNQAELTATGITSVSPAPAFYLSDDPFVNGVSDPEALGDEDPTVFTVVAPGPLSKQGPGFGSAAIGQTFSYQITVPATAVDAPLYDVRVFDALPANLEFLSASASVGAATYNLSNTGSGNNLVLEETAIGLDIPTGQQAVVTLQVRLANQIDNQDSSPAFSNTASYTYSRVQGGSQSDGSGTQDATTALSIVEPQLTASKAVTNVTQGGSIAARGGDILEYTVNLASSGTSTAFDVSIIDTLPDGLVMVPGSAEITLGGSANPVTPGVDGNVLSWGRVNGDERLDIPVRQTLTLTYQVQVNGADGGDLVNSVEVDWTSLDGAQLEERTGNDRTADAAALNNYFTTATSTLASVDVTAFTKAVVGDSWGSGIATSADTTARAGDFVTYQLALTLPEGLIQGVVVTDVLDAGLAFVDVVSINGVSGAPYSSTGVFTHGDINAGNVPVAGQTGTLTWTLGDISNAVNNDPSDDRFEIIYRARVQHGAAELPAPTPTATTLGNQASLQYAYANGTPAPALPASASVEVLQPQISALTKSGMVLPASGSLVGDGLSAATAFVVDITANTMDFSVEACNSGDAPAYGVRLLDDLPAELDESSITGLTVSIDGAPLAAADYSYTAPAARDGSITVDLNTPLDPASCVVLGYRIGFHTDIAPNQVWSNVAELGAYWSRPSLDSADAREYMALNPVAASSVWMTNTFEAQAPTKTISVSEATIGQDVTYTITVPGTPVNAALGSVSVGDTLDPALQFVSATVELNGAPLAVSAVQSGQDLSWDIGDIPAGQQAVISLTARVANTQSVNTAISPVQNLATYNYTGTAQPLTSTPVDLTIVEPELAMTKTVANITDPGQPAASGDVLEYTLTIPNGGSSTAFDVNVADLLPAQLSYVDASASAVIDANPVPGFNAVPTVSGTTLIWGRDNGDASLVIPAGSELVLGYRVNVDTVTAENIVNSALVDWTSLDGAFTGNRERTGAGCPTVTPPDTYCTGATSGLDVDYNIDLTKAYLSDSWNGDGNLRVGDTVEYEVTLALVEGTHTDLVLADTLPVGMAFVEVVRADFFGLPQGAPPVPDVSPDGRTATWTLATLTNPVDGDSANDFLTIVYRARVQNGDVLNQQPTTQALNNTVTLNYPVGGVPAAPLIANAAVNALQPLLSVSKSALTSIDGDTVIRAGETAIYTVDVANTGAAPAYDLVLEDILPAGLRQNGVTPVSASLVNAGGSFSVTPSYDNSTGTALWDFDSAGGAAIPAGDTLRVVYEVTGDGDLGAGLTLTNSARALRYYSFDDDLVPSNSSVDWREEYGPSEAATSILTTPIPGVLSKVTAQDTVAIGEQLTYSITIPETPVDVALQDVRIMDDLTATGVDLEFVSATLTGVALENLGSASNLILAQAGGINVPAGGQVEVLVTVEVLNTANNQSRVEPFINRAWYDYDTGVARLGDDATTGADANPVTIAHPELVVTKSGPASLRVGTPDNFTLLVENSGATSAWNPTLTDWLPNPAPGGMCDMQPAIQSAEIQKADGSTIALAAADFSVALTEGEPTCEFTMTLLADVPLGSGDRLSLAYEVALDDDNIHGSTLMNIAGATQWYSAAAVSDQRFGYQRQLSDGTPAVVDHEDSHEFFVESAELETRKTVFNVTTGESGATASPGDTLRYTIEIQNVSDIPLNSFSLLDELDRLNATAMFAADSLVLVSTPDGANAAVTGNGGALGTGLLEVNGLSIAPAGQAGDLLTVVFEATLVQVITSDTEVLNQAQLAAGSVIFGNSDDPLVAGVEDPTQTLISSAPQFVIEKTSEDMTGDPAILVPGDVLRYTLTIENVGSEDALEASLRDQVPANTTYIAASTFLNGAGVADVNGLSPLTAGMTVQSPGADPGVLPADPAATGTGKATVTFDVTINDVNEGTLISNQGFLNGTGAGSGAFTERPSDDPATDVADDPTVDVVGQLPLLLAHKTVAIEVDNGTASILDPGDTLRYTIVITNTGEVDATLAELLDPVPANTTYVAGSTYLNDVAVPDNTGGRTQLDVGLPVSSGDRTPPLPGAAEGVITAGESAVVTFDVMVNAGTARGTVISNQGRLSSQEVSNTLTDADGDPANGAQPTDIVVGDAQQLSITKQVAVVGGGAAEAGAVLEYLVTVKNISSVPVSGAVITDDLATAGDGVLTYVDASAYLNGLQNGVAVNGMVVSADYGASYGNLMPGEEATLRFQARLADNLAIGSRVTNTALVVWGDPQQSATAQVTIDLGGTPGIANLAGYLWHDANFSLANEGQEQVLPNWNVALYRGDVLLERVQSDENGYYQFDGLVPNMYGGLPLDNEPPYQIRFSAPGAGVNSAALGFADSDFTNGLHTIADIYVEAGRNLQALNLPIAPNGVVYDSVLRAPVAGATLTMVRASSGAELPDTCFDDSKQQNQVTLPGGHYRFDINFSGGACPANADYLIQVQLPGAGYVAGPSAVIPPQSGVDTAGFDVAACVGSAADAVPATTGHCEIQASERPPGLGVAARDPGTDYYLRLTLSDLQRPRDSQLFNNHIAVDPVLEGALSITKTTAMQNVTRSRLVPYTITFNNTLPVPLNDLRLVDFFPAGFKYVAGSARVDGEAIEPQVEGLQLAWDNLSVGAEQTRTAKLLLVVGSGVGEGEYVNRARVFNALSGQYASGEASATVRVVPDPSFDCTDVVGKVFDDRNMNGYQDSGETGVAGARVVSATGLNATTDAHGRFHITCAAVPNQERGSNFVLKLDDRSLPSGYRLTTENPRVQRATRGKMMEFNFGAGLHRVVRLDLADAVFEPRTAMLRPQWQSRLSLLQEKLEQAPSVLRLSYLAEIESESLVESRLQAIKAQIAEAWLREGGGYELKIETEIFWRRGAPPEKGGWE